MFTENLFKKHPIPHSQTTNEKASQIACDYIICWNTSWQKSKFHSRNEKCLPPKLKQITLRAVPLFRGNYSVLRARGRGFLKQNSVVQIPPSLPQSFFLSRFPEDERREANMSGHRTHRCRFRFPWTARRTCKKFARERAFSRRYSSASVVFLGFPIIFSISLWRCQFWYLEEPVNRIDLKWVNFVIELEHFQHHQ